MEFLSNKCGYLVIDAGFKLPAGLLKANMAWLGSFDECLDINSPLTQVRGKYCLTTITLDAKSILGSAQTSTSLLVSTSHVFRSQKPNKLF